MPALNICPRCFGEWMPFSRQEAASQVCMECRTKPTLAAIAHTGRRITLLKVPPAITGTPVSSNLVRRPAQTPIDWQFAAGVGIFGSLAAVSCVGIAFAVGMVMASRPLSSNQSIEITAAPAERVMKSQEALPVAPTIPDPMTKNDSPPPLEPIASRDVTLEAKPAAPDVVEPERSAQPKIKDLADRKQFKRMRPVPSTDELLAQLLKAREMDLEKKFNGPTARSLLAYAKSHRNEKPQPSREIFSRNDLVGMPVLKGDACRLGKESTEALNKLSSQLRPIMADSASSSFRDVGSSLRERLETSSSRLWETPEAVPGLVQMLQVEDRPTRLLLVDMLARIECRESTRALARRAMFDVSENVREAAVNALRRRPAEDSREVLLEGLRYPWPAAACFAAEALVNLEDTGAVPHLVRLLDEADPAGPCAVMSGSSATHQIREIVRINHLRNCMLCHPPSLASNDPVRAAVPDPTQPLSGTYSPQSASLGLFVRADVTYLKQDFSVQQPVVNPGVMPAHQRYDYFVRARIVSAPSATARPQAALYPQKQAVLFALCELTGEDYGDTTAGWLECLDSAARTERDRDTRAAENPY